MDVGLCVRDARDECNCFPWERVDFSVSVRLESVEEDRTEHVAPSVDGSDLGWQEGCLLRRPTFTSRKNALWSREETFVYE